MRIHCMIQKIFHFLCRPSVQWLMGLIISVFLAMSLGYAALVIAFPRSGNEVTMAPLSQQASTVTLVIGGLAPPWYLGRQIKEQMTMRKMRNQDAEGRQA